MVPTQELKGSIEKIIYQSTDTGFTVFVLKSDKDNGNYTAKGYTPGLQIGQDVLLSGCWISHPKFGQQFDVKNFMPIVPTSILGIKKYLGSGLIKGIGKAYAEKLVDYFGAETIDVIETNPDRLKEVPGIGEKRIELIKSSWQENQSISRIMIFLQEKGISPSYASKIYKHYKNEAIAVIQQNPYKLAEDVWGIGFKLADQIAQNMGIKKDSISRIKAGINFAISTEVANGHLYVESEELKNKTLTLLELDPEENGSILRQAFVEINDENKIKIVSHSSKHFVTSAQIYNTEKNVSNLIKKINETNVIHDFNFDEIYKKISDPESIGINLETKQQEAILTPLQNKISIITGGPGTGKTTVTKTLLKILDDNKLKYKLAAPTGRAAKRMFESTKKHAETIHRLLEFDVSIMKFKRNENSTIDTDFLIIDEASMIDIFLANSILKAVGPKTHVLFIGDVDQLPSVGAGNFLKDLIASNVVAYKKLTEIFRQAQDSMIVVNAHRVNRGEFPTSASTKPIKDFYLIKEENPENLNSHIKKIYELSLRKYKIDHSNAITLSPMNKGTAGTINLNVHIQQILNPNATVQIPRHGYNFKKNDRVMQIKNNYDKFVFNGDIGSIEMIDLEEKILKVKFGEKEVEYKFDELDELVLAYSVSIHKSQGSEFDAVIIPIFTQHFTLLQRNLIYTAITRAKKLCIIIGQIKAIAMAIKNNKSVERKTFLKEYLTTTLECR